MAKLDKVLATIKPVPDFEGETITGLPCDCCSKRHTRLIGIKVEGILVWQVTSPCLEEIARKACNAIG